MRALHLVAFFFGAAWSVSFRATSVQLTPYFNASWSSAQVIAHNTAVIVSRIQLAKAGGSDIVVFPEGANGWFEMFSSTKQRGLNASATRASFVEYGEVVSLSSCAQFSIDTHPQLKALSCAAQVHSITVISNLMDVQPCSPGVAGCPSDGMFVWNCDVIIEPSGSVVRKYYKSHLAGEYPNQQQPATSQAFMYETTFGARIGVLICQDIIFDSTANYFAPGSIDTLVWTAFWGNLDPVVVGMNLLQSWSQLKNTNVIAANLMQAGGGIISAGGIFVSHLIGGLGTCSVATESCDGTLSSAIAAPVTVPFPTISVSRSAGLDCTFGGPTLGPVRLPAKCFRLDNASNRTGRITASDPFGQGEHDCIANVTFANAPAEQYVVIGAVFVDQKPGTLDIPIYRICAVMRCPAFPSCNEYDGTLTSTSVFNTVELVSTASAPVIYAYIQSATLTTGISQSSYAKNGPQTAVVTTSSFVPAALGAAVVVGVSMLASTATCLSAAALLCILVLSL